MAPHHTNILYSWCHVLLQVNGTAYTQNKGRMLNSPSVFGPLTSGLRNKLQSFVH